MADNPSPPPNTSKVKKRKKAEQNNTSDDDADAEFIARYTKIVTDMKKAKIMFPRFLLMMSGDEDKSLSRLSTFAIQKGIEGLVGEPKNIKRLRSGDLLIEVDRETYSTKLLAIKEIAGIPVKVSPHRTLNTSKGVIRTQEIKNTTNEELKAQLKRQGVSDARIITIKKNGDTIKLNTAVLTFNFPKPPADIKVGFELCPIQLYIPHPLRCFKCQQFGHHQEGCKRERVCGRCGQSTEHPDSSCTYPIKCANCGGNHAAYSRDCPRWKTEKEIQRIGTERKISFPEARKIVEGVSKQPSFASVVAKQVVSVGCQTDAVEIRSATGATNVSATPASSSSEPNTSKDTSTAKKHANTSAANTKQSGSADKTKASRLSTQKSETVTNKSKDDSKSSEKQKPKIKPKPKPPDRLTKAMKNPVSTYNQFQAMEVVEPADDEDGSDDGVSLKLAPTAAAIHAQLNPGKKKQP